MLKQLSLLNGTSGFEENVAEFIINNIRQYADRIEKDSFGNVYAFKAGTAPKKTIALTAHTDEVGLIVSSITEDGLLKFRAVGGISDDVLPGKRVLVGDTKIAGVIGSRAVHLLTKDEREQKADIKKLYIDIGATTKEQAEKYVKKGDAVYFKGYFEETEDFYIGKAFDDRAGCHILCELIKREYEDDMWFIFTAQEETGLRGATVASRRIDADYYIVVENTTCLDMPSVAKEKRSTELQKGPALTIVDGASFADVKLRQALAETGVEFQYKNVAAGGNDAGAISRNGKRVVAVSIPSRYLHTPVGVISKKDLNATIKMLDSFLKGEVKC